MAAHITEALQIRDIILFADLAAGGNTHRSVVCISERIPGADVKTTICDLVLHEAVVGFPHLGMDEYDTIFVEFPIWWYIAPTIVNAFLESYDLTGKTIIPFATSGGSGMGKTNEALKPSCTGATLLEGKVWKSTAKKEELSVWADSLACR